MSALLLLSSRDTRALVAGAAGVGLLVVFAKGLPAALAWQRDRAAAATEIVRRRAARRVAARVLPALRDTLLAGRRRIVAWDSRVIVSRSSPAAAAMLAGILEEAADDASFKIGALQLRPDSALAGSLAVVAVRVNGTTDAAGLASFLRAVEGGDTPMRVRELVVTQSDPGPPATRVEALRAEILVEALARITPSLSVRK